jgi:PAS domain S-box-containing protein
MADNEDGWQEKKAHLEAQIAAFSEESRSLQILNRCSVAIASDFDLERLVQTVTDAGVELSRAEFGAFFYNALDDKGESYTLYTLSGASREAFAKFPMPRNTLIFEPTFRGTGVVRSGDITKDPRYGKNPPYNGKPPGHLPVCSYLAVPVIARSGEVLGGLFFGHSKTDQFSELSERLIVSIATQASVAIENARLYQTTQQELAARTKAEAELQKLNETLEERAIARARQLAANASRLDLAEQHLALLIDAVVDYAIFMLDPVGNVVSWNPGAQRIKGYEREEIVGQHFSRFYTANDRAQGLPARALSIAAEAGRFEMEGWRLRKDGTVFWASVVISAIRDPTGALLGFAKITRDLTERRASEERLRQAQRMEAIGQLTGGVAHDFNNLLTVITGNIEALKRRLAERNEPALERLASAAQRGAERGALLVHRLLAFSRSQPLVPKPVSINALVTGMSDMLRRTLGETILIETVLAGGLWQTFVDTTELESAILNLAINARDAMPDGGKLTIEAANVYLDEAYAAEAEITPGQYVGIFVSDTGTGMAPDVIAKAFEPFFTTKEIGEGTGLGLSQVYGFIRQSGGHVKIYSEVGAGTTLKLYLRRYVDASAKTETASLAPATPQGRGETILVVEDDPDVRTFTIDMLSELGYRVLATTDGPSALRMLDAHREIMLLFTDIGLPGGMNGRQLADEAQRRRSNLKVLFTSGYARNAIMHHGRLDPGVELLSKPFTYGNLGTRVRRLLDDK